MKVVEAGAAHLSQLSRIVTCPDTGDGRGRGPQQAQRARRDLEDGVRRRAAELCHRLEIGGQSIRWVARKLGVSPSALWSWSRGPKIPGEPPPLRGRPRKIVQGEKRDAVRAAITLLGPHVGTPSLSRVFPSVARSELARQLRSFRSHFHRHHRVLMHQLHWLNAGRVWAMDFSEPPMPVNGVYPQLFAVRDLGSGHTLMWAPVSRATSESVQEILEELFTRHHPPVVLKSDNDSAFGTPELCEMLMRHRVTALKSPPYAPWYNGSIEVGQKVLKRHAGYSAHRRNGGQGWDIKDITWSVGLANELCYPRGPKGPSSAEIWSQRKSISTPERNYFESHTDWAMQKALEAHGKEPMDREFAELKRQAITNTCVAIGYLEMRKKKYKATRRRIRPPFFAQVCS